MFSLFSRIGWMVSIILSFVVLLTLTEGEFIEDFYDMGFFLVILIFLVAAVFKKIFFSENFIRNSLNNSGVSQESIKNETHETSPVERDMPLEESGESPEAIIQPYAAKSDIHEAVTTEKQPVQENEPYEPSAFSLWIHAFFSDRPLAKVGGILLFLGALFFLWLIFDAVGPVGKILIGLLFGFSLIATGYWLDKKNTITESRVLLGIGIAVNYLTILSGRHILSGGIAGDPLFSDMFATFALILNTALAIILALVYHSRVLLGFAFILAYLTPFIVGSESSSVALLSLYTTIISIAIAVILSFYSRTNESTNNNYLETIAAIGITALFSIGSIDTKEYDFLWIVIGLAVTILSFLWYFFAQKRSPLAILIGGYIVLMVASFSVTSFLLLPLAIIGLLFLTLFSVFSSLISVALYGIFGIFSLIIGLFGFWVGGSHEFGMLMIMGIMVFALLGTAVVRIGSFLLGTVAVIGLGVFSFLGINSLYIADIVTSTDILLIKGMALFLLIGASVFAIRLKDAAIYFFATIASGLLIAYPNTVLGYLSTTILAYSVYFILSFVIPYILMQKTGEGLQRKPFLLGSLPVGAIIIAYGIYQIGHLHFPGVALGVAYIAQAIVSLGYAVFISQKLNISTNTATLNQENKNTLVVLFAIPLSLFTFSIAFLFRDIPGMMSLAWILESSILYLVSIRMNDERIFTFAHGVFLVGIVKEFTLIGAITREDWLSFGLLAVMMVGVFSSLIILKNQNFKERIAYDILHIIAVAMIGYGISKIIPVTNIGWNILGPASFILVVSYLYRIAGKDIHAVFLAVMLLGINLMFLERFDMLDKENIFPIIIQLLALSILFFIGYSSFRKRGTFSGIHLGISIIGTLVLSSLYVKHFFGTFAVSLYLTIIASALIIHGIKQNLPILRTIGLYIGIFIMLKIFFYDIWYGSNDMITRVIALMVTGGIMIYLSQLYGKYVSRTWTAELDFSNIIPSIAKTGENTSQENATNTEDNPFTGELARDMKDIDVTMYSAVRFTKTDGESFVVKRIAVLKMAKRITELAKKNQFAPDELNNVYDIASKNLQSTLSKAEFENLMSKLQSWVKAGGSVELINK